MILRAIWSQRDTGDKNIVQALIAQVFDHAVLKIRHEEGLGGRKEEVMSLRGNDMPENNYTFDERQHEEYILTMWDTFMNELWYMFPKDCWVRKIRKRHFIKFFSLLANARLIERCFPQSNGREHCELVRAISKFLDAASETGCPWILGKEDDSVEMY